MSFNLVGRYNLNFSGVSDTESAGVPTTRGQARNWILRAVPLTDAPKDLYVLVIPVYRGPGIVAEAPLLCKFFPKQLPLVFTTPVPDAPDFQGADVHIRLLLRSIGGRKPNRTMTVDLFSGVNTVPVGGSGLIL